MADRKTPILLRRAPLSGEIMALYRYTRKRVRGRDVIEAQGKQPVTADFETLMLEQLMDDGAESIVTILDGVASGAEITDEERAEVRVFRERLREVCERHNARIDRSEAGEAAHAD